MVIKTAKEQKTVSINKVYEIIYTLYNSLYPSSSFTSSSPHLLISSSPHLLISSSPHLSPHLSHNPLSSTFPRSS
jgi:hypothetical protein